MPIKRQEVSTFRTPAGVLKVVYDDVFIHQASFIKSDCVVIIPNYNSPLAMTIARNIEAYNLNPQHRFDLPLQLKGTAYQERVWHTLKSIPPGNTTTYGALARQLQTSPRAIGQACKKNPIALFIPCHRVVGQNNLGGFMGTQQALHYKRALLHHEAKFDNT